MTHEPIGLMPQRSGLAGEFQPLIESQAQNVRFMRAQFS